MRKKIYNPQCWGYDGLKLEEVNFLRFVLKKNCSTQNTVMNSTELINTYIKTYNPDATDNLYWNYLIKWVNRDIIEYGTSLNHWWFNFAALKKPCNSGYVKIKEANDLFNYKTRTRTFLRDMVGMNMNTEEDPFVRANQWYYYMRDPKNNLKENKNEQETKKETI